MGCPWFSSFCNLARLFLSHAKVTIHDPNTGRAAAVAYIDGRFRVGAVRRRRGEEGKSGTEGGGETWQVRLALGHTAWARLAG